MAVSRRLRFEILRRDNHTCRYCGSAAPDVKLTVDHVTPVALGGSDDPTNLVTACAACNGGKSSMPADAPIVANVADDALRWAAAMQAAAEMQIREQAEYDDYAITFHTEWTAWTYSGGKTFPLPPAWPTTIHRFCEMGIELSLIRAAVDTTLSRDFVKDRFSYFCGVVYKKHEQRQEIARALIESEGADA